MSDYIDRAANVIERAQYGITTPMMARNIADDLHAAGLLKGLPRPEDGCACTPHSQDAGGGHTEHLMEYEPACPEHSEHLWDPRRGMWVDRAAHDAAVAAKALRDAADALDELQTPTNEHPAQRDPALWLHERADLIEREGGRDA